MEQTNLFLLSGATSSLFGPKFEYSFEMDHLASDSNQLDKLLSGSRDVKVIFAPKNNVSDKEAEATAHALKDILTTKLSKNVELVHFDNFPSFSSDREIKKRDLVDLVFYNKAAKPVFSGPEIEESPQAVEERKKKGLIERKKWQARGLLALGALSFLTGIIVIISGTRNSRNDEPIEPVEE